MTTTLRATLDAHTRICGKTLATDGCSCGWEGQHVQWADHREAAVRAALAAAPADATRPERETLDDCPCRTGGWTPGSGPNGEPHPSHRCDQLPDAAHPAPAWPSADDEAAVEGHTRTRRHWCPRHHQFEEVREYAVALSAPPPPADP